MAEINPNASSLIDAYIDNKEGFSKEICIVIRQLIHQSTDDVVEDWKWNLPVFNKNGMVCGFAAFKKHVALTFFKGVQMSDSHQLFWKDGTAQVLRTIKFKSITEIPENILIDYFKEAFLISEFGLKKNKYTRSIEIPELLEDALNHHKIAKENFNNMAYTYRKEYAQYINDAKRETTKLKRLDKVISNLNQNLKLYKQ